MNYQKYALPVACFILFTALVSFMASVIAATADEITIKQVMKQQWDEPDSPIGIPLVEVVSNFAIADWTQGLKGGRALLRRDSGVWQVMLCGDANLKDLRILNEAGINFDIASKLIDAVDKSENSLTTEQLELIATFKGIVKVQSSQHHAEKLHGAN